MRLTPSPPRPELFQPSRMQPLRLRIPEPEMHLNTGRDLCIEEVAAPLPTRLADQCRQVVNRETIEAANWFVPDSGECFERVAGLSSGAVKIQIVLHAVQHIRDELWTMRE